MVLAAFLTFANAAAPIVTLWSGTTTCGADRIAEALYTVRPDLALQLGPPVEGRAHVILERSGDDYVVQVLGLAEPVRRAFRDPGDCEAVAQTAALIVNSALSEVDVASARLPRPIALLLQVGGGIGQGPVGWTTSLSAEGGLRWGWLEAALDFEVALPATAAIPPNGSASGALGDYQATGVVAEVLGGWAPRLGWGHFLLGPTGGLEIAIVSVASPHPDLFQTNTTTAVTPFLGGRASYLLDLPLLLFAGVRAEERWTPAAATFQTELLNQQYLATSTSVWTFEALAVFGRRFE